MDLPLHQCRLLLIQTEPHLHPQITTHPPGLGISLEEFETPFIAYGFTFASYQGGTVQGDYSSPDFMTWTVLILVGEEDLSEATLIVMNGSNQTALAEILTLFFRVAFPDQTNRDAAMSWFANDSGFNSGQDSGHTIVGDLAIVWSRDSVIGYSITFYPAE